MYQAAVSKRADNTGRVMEESEVCSLPGGLASVRRQFETQEIASSHNVTQFHFQHRSVQEMSNSEVTVSSSRQVLSGSQLNHNQETMVSYGGSALASSYENHEIETEEDVPRYTTKELRDHFEKTIEEAAPHKQVKISRDINRSKWASSVTQNSTVASGEYETSATAALEDAETAMKDYDDFPPPPADDSDYLPPPPPDLLQMPPENHSMPECHYALEPEEPALPSKCTFSREAYFKQRSKNELKRLYKHIHPEVRKNIEKELYSDFSESENVQVQSQEYAYDEDGEENNLEEEGEWEEILPGDVQSMRWMFENKPLDTIKDESPDEDDDNNRKITQQEVILGKDVRRTAWMFETKPSSPEYKNKVNKLDKGDVRAAAWLFENQTMDTLNKKRKEDDLTKEIVFTEEDGDSTIYMIDNKCMQTLGHTETIDESHLLILRSVLEEINGEMKTITSTFDTQFKCVIMGQASEILEVKSVRKIETEMENSIASRWLFDTQPLDLTNTECSTFKLVCSLSMEDSNKGDWGRWLFEIKTLSSLTDWESSKVEKKEIMGTDVRKHCMVFETQPMDTLKDDANAKPQTIEDVIGGNVKSARNFFESSPQVARKNCLDVGKLKKRPMNEEEKGDVRHQKWRFESQPLEHIGEERKEVVRTVNVENDLIQEDGTSCRADVRRNCWVFETQPMDCLKDDANSRPLTKEEVIAGNVKSARHYFETVPAEELKELAEVGKLKKSVPLEEEKGDVRHQKWRFESQPLEQIREERKEVVRTIDMEEIDKVDVSNYKHIFESTKMNQRIDESQKILIEGVQSGSVQSNKTLFESNPLYAMQDSSGHFHEVKTVRREEVVKGDVTTCKWMFETRPIDQFDESISKYQIIKGISKQELETGDVKTAKWLFETQPLDAIKYFSNIEDEETVVSTKHTDVMKGDVKTCKWLFETKPMDILYERADQKGECEKVPKGDVKTCTWLFETQALDTIHDETETIMKTRTVDEEEIRGKDVRTACFLFETENLENLSGEEANSFKRITEIDIASGDVSGMKYIFENQTSDIMTSTSEEARQKLKRVQTEDIQKGNVVNCRWLFENQSIDMIHDNEEEHIGNRTVYDIQGGNVNQGRFIFETCSLDKIHEVEDSETEEFKKRKIVRDEEEKGDVRNYTMMFETQPLYAIQDKEGHYHEVTTVTSEEVNSGDVVGTRWLFETKPLDAIKDTDEVYIIKSVTQQDVQKGDVTSARWKFETQPLDRIREERKALQRTVDDIQGGNVKINKHRFESDDLSQMSVKTVNVSEIQKGDVRTAKWRFETQSIDQIKSMSAENLIETVKKEDVAKGDVRQSVWLFEKNPLDHIKEVDEDTDSTVIQEEIPKADVKTATWLFETTPFDDFNETKVEKSEIIGKSVKGTLAELYSQRMVRSKGILIEADEIGDVRMAKYQLMNQQAPEIQREDIIRGDLQTIMMNLLNQKQSNERQVVIDSEEKGNISSTVQQLFSQEKESSTQKEEILRGDIQDAINNLFKVGSAAKHGILIQEDEKGDVQMTLYSLLNKQDSASVEKEDIVRGDIRSALQRLSSADRPDESVKIKVDDIEKGNVNFFSTCIESGTLDYLKQLHLGPDETHDKAEKETIIGGDIKSTKRILNQSHVQVERTVEDVIPGDVHNAVKVFMSEPSSSLDKLQKEEIVKGDLRAALSSLSESVNQTVVVEKEEVVKGNIPKTLRCLERAQKRQKEMEKPDIVPGNIRGALRSLERSSTSKVETVVEDLVSGDVKATLKSLERAKQTVKEVEKEEIVRGDIHLAKQNLQDASTDKRICQQEIDVQGDVRGTIQLFMETPPSPRMQRRSSIEEEIKGDVRMSIKSLYESQEEHSQQEREEVIKGDVKSTIKSLMENAQREAPKVQYRRVRVKQSPPVKNLNTDAQRNVQKIKTANANETTKTVSVEHKTITQNHGIKTLKTEFRNLNSTSKGMIKLDKTRVKTDVYILQSNTPEPDLPLPPPPPPVVDTDLLPPPPPPVVESDIDNLPPPPLPSEQDFLPPPPSQQELESMPAPPSPGVAKKMTVKKVKGPSVHQVTKLEPKVEVIETQQVAVTSGKTFETSQSTTTKTIRTEILPPSESPQPLKKVIIPVRFTPPPSPPPFMRGKMSKFSTPLMQAEDKFRRLREDSTPPTTPTPPPRYTPDLITTAIATLSTLDSEVVKKSASNIAKESNEKSHDAEKQVVVADTKIAAGNEKNVIMSSAKQQIVSNESLKVVSVQKTSSVSVVKQQTHTTSSQKAVSVSSTASVTADIQQKQITDGESDISQKTKTTSLKESAQTVQSETLATTKNMKSNQSKTVIQTAAKTSENSKKDAPNKALKGISSPQLDKKKKNDHSPPKKQEKDQSLQRDNRSNGKSSKSPEKVKKPTKQEKQMDATTNKENEKLNVSHDVKMEVKKVEVKVTSEAQPKQEENKANASSVPASAKTASTTTPSEAQTPPKRKKKSKKSRGAVQQEQTKDVCIESKVEVSENKKSTQIRESMTVSQVHTSVREEQIKVKENVSTTVSKEIKKSNEQRTNQKQVKEPENKKEVPVLPSSSKERSEDSRVVPIIATGEAEQKALKSATGGAVKSQQQQVQMLISHITELQKEKCDSKSVKAFLTTVPDWFISPERKSELQQTINKSDATNFLSDVKLMAESYLMKLDDNETLEKHECELVSERLASFGAAQRISKISIGSSKVETQMTSRTEIRKEEVSQSKSVDLRAPSPSLRMRPPSPTFITIESTRKSASPTLLHRPLTPPTPPPRRSDTPTSRLTRITPSPTFDRAENLARLKDTTAKLSRGVTPPPILTSQLKSEVVESASIQVTESTTAVTDKNDFTKQIEGMLLNATQSTGDAHLPDPDDEEISELTFASVREKKEFFEEAQKAKNNKTYVRKEQISIPERLGPDMEEECVVEVIEFEDELPRADLSSLLNKFKSVDEKTYAKKEAIPLAERLHHDADSTDKEKAEQEMPCFDIRAIKNVFELSEQTETAGLTETAADTSKRESTKERKPASQPGSPLPHQRKQVESVVVDPSGFSESKTITERFSDVDEFGNQVSGTSTAVTHHSESTQQVPFSYADAVKRKAAKRTETYDEDSTEKLLRNFHKTWTESETVFKSLGYTVSSETSQVLSEQTDSSSEVRALHGLPEESLSDGRPDSGQKKVP